MGGIYRWHVALILMGKKRCETAVGFTGSGGGDLFVGGDNRLIGKYVCQIMGRETNIFFGFRFAPGGFIFKFVVFFGHYDSLLCQKELPGMDMVQKRKSGACRPYQF